MRKQPNFSGGLTFFAVLFLLMTHGGVGAQVFAGTRQSTAASSKAPEGVPVDERALSGDPLDKVPQLPEGTQLFKEEAKFAFRGRIGGFATDPSKYAVYYDVEGRRGVKDASAFGYRKIEGPSFCGGFIILLGDFASYQTMTFWVKGKEGGETFELGMNDTISNKREDAVIAGSIHRYLPGGMTTQWQQVVVPLRDFFGPDLSRVYSLVFQFNEAGTGRFAIDDLRFHKEQLVYREDEAEVSGVLLLDNFDHSSVNLLGNKSNAYKRLPSVADLDRVQKPRRGKTGRSLKITFDKRSSGWCGYYTLLNQIDGAYFDLTPYKEVAFWIRGQTGGEDFTVGMADKSWLTIGDSVKAGPVSSYLKGGISRRWQEVVIPLNDFGKLDWSQMGSFVVNFHKTGQGVVYLDDLRFIRKTEGDLLKEWEEEQ